MVSSPGNAIERRLKTTPSQQRRPPRSHNGSGAVAFKNQDCHMSDTTAISGAAYYCMEILPHRKRRNARFQQAQDPDDTTG